MSEFGEGLELSDGEVETEAMTRNVSADDAVFTPAYVAKFSPRSKEACQREGILPRELIPV